MDRRDFIKTLTALGVALGLARPGSDREAVSEPIEEPPADERRYPEPRVEFYNLSWLSISGPDTLDPDHVELGLSESGSG